MTATALIVGKSKHIGQQRTGLHSLLPLLCALLLFGALSSYSNSAQARPYILRPGTRPGVYEGGFGVLAGLTSGGLLVSLHNSIGYHFLGRSSGSALGFDFDLGFGGIFTMQLGP